MSLRSFRELRRQHYLLFPKQPQNLTVWESWQEIVKWWKRSLLHNNKWLQRVSNCPEVFFLKKLTPPHQKVKIRELKGSEKADSNTSTPLHQRVSTKGDRNINTRLVFSKKGHKLIQRTQGGKHEGRNFPRRQLWQTWVITDKMTCPSSKQIMIKRRNCVGICMNRSGWKKHKNGLETSPRSLAYIIFELGIHM